MNDNEGRRGSDFWDVVCPRQENQMRKLIFWVKMKRMYLVDLDQNRGMKRNLGKRETTNQEGVKPTKPCLYI